MALTEERPKTTSELLSFVHVELEARAFTRNVVFFDDSCPTTRLADRPEGMPADLGRKALRPVEVDEADFDIPQLYLHEEA